jgi:ketosteroid isomerase-like protein
VAEQRSAMGQDFEVLRRAVENLDADLLANLYADDAEVRVVSHEAPRIAEAYRDAYGRQQFIQRVEGAVVGEGCLALRRVM